MYDFKLIRKGKNLFNATDFSHLFEENFDFLRRVLSEQNDSKKIVVTHHVPTLLNYPPQYEGSIINEAFATELSGFIQENEIDYWIYGHHHYNAEDFLIGKTKMVTNQLGYVQNMEHLGFKSGVVLEI